MTISSTSDGQSGPGHAADAADLATGERPEQTGTAAEQRRIRFNLNRAEVVDQNFRQFICEWRGESAPGSRRPDELVRPGTRLTCKDAVELFESQIIARWQDIVAREMRARNEGFYTIGSAGHEGNAILGRVTRHTDIAFVHYRSGAFMAERARQVPHIDFVRDTMLAFAASSEDPVSGGRHKVWGHRELWVPPQTSTIASHMPKAVGVAMSIARCKRFQLPLPFPPDSIVVCSFGDASVSHATAQTAFNAAARCWFHRLPTPILFVCEDNGLGISVETPSAWIEANYRARHGLEYFRADGLDLIDTYEKARAAVELCRTQRCPVFLHLKVIRLMGHAGSDAETEYRTWEQITAAEANDPLLKTARLLLETGTLAPEQVMDMYDGIAARVREAGRVAATRPKLRTAQEVTRCLAPYSRDAVDAEAARTPDPQARLRLFGSDELLPEHGRNRHMAALINRGLHDVLLKYPNAILFGEDVARKGGVYHVTAGLTAKFGAGRVFNTVLDETTILGLAVGAAHIGLLPMPEIQYLAYYHNAEDQVRGEACSLQFFSNDQFRNPMVLRIAGWAYQKGFGGHFHNDNSIAALRDVPGLIVATPSRGDDAVRMLRTCLALARVDGRVVVFIEPIALYMTKDLYEPRDQGWSFAYPEPGSFIRPGEGHVYEPGASDLTIITFANGVYMSLRAARVLAEEHGVRARVVDLRWLSPLNEAFIVEQAAATGRALVVDEGRRSGGVSEAIMTVLYERCRETVMARRLAALDTYIPLGAAAELVLPTEPDIIRQALELIRAG